MPRTRDRRLIQAIDRTPVALVTGASRGIGKAIALELGSGGAHVAVNFRTNEAEAKAVADSIRSSGYRAESFQADVSSTEDVTAMVNAVHAKLGNVDILINNAGMASVRSIEEQTEEDFDRALAINLKSAFLCTQAVLPSMRARRFGRIINISTIGARVGASSVSIAYGAAKAGLEGLTRAYAIRLAAEGITVNAIAPGLVDTDMGKPLLDAGVAERIPMGRAGTPAEIADAVRLVIDNPYMTGQVIGVNGGSLFA